MQNVTASAIGRNRNGPRPGTNARGASTSRVQRVAISSGMATSLAPEKAASRGRAPSPRWRWVFSRQMMALSTSGPMASASPARVMTLSVWPVAFRNSTAVRTEIGMVSTAMSVSRHSPRKTRMTSEQSTAPRTPSSARLSMALRT
jgi:hypothetical protein